jgi:hypothetical protein
MQTLASRLSRNFSTAKRLLRYVYVNPHFKKGKTNNQHQILLDITETEVYRRYYITLAYCLSNIPADVSWRFNLRYFAVPAEGDDLFWWTKFPIGMPFNSTYYKSPNIIITDRPNEHSRSPSRIITLKHIEGKSDSNSLPRHVAELPFLAHPRFLLNDDYLQPPTKDTDRKRRYSVAYAGNCDPSLYCGQFLHSDLLPRNNAVQLIRNNYERESFLINKWEDKQYLQAADSRILIVDSFSAGLDRQEFNWLLAESDFTLILPGISCPFTHLLHESTYRGSVPIIQKSAATTKIWKHNHNCLTYHDKTSFLPVIEYALHANHKEISRLRGNLYETVLKHYSIPCIGQQLISDNITTILLRNA